MSTSSRIDQVAGHLNYPKGLLAGQVAIITGSGQGIGAEAAKLFAKEGAKVVVSDIDGGECAIPKTKHWMLISSIAKASNTANEINQAGGSAIAVAGDMLNDAYLTELVKKTAEFGNGKIHIIVNNAGYTWDGVIHKVNTTAFCEKDT
jgi:3-oxoacyl-[acyl-carrier protein] reductase